MGCDGRVSAYWCAIGTTGTLTPTIRPISWANMPPAFTTTSQVMRPRSVSTWVTRRRPCRSSTPMPVTRVMVAISAPRLRAPAASAIVRSVGLSQPSVGSHTAPRTSAGSNRPWKRSSASSVEMSSRGRPNVWAQPAWRASSSIRSTVEARRNEPTSCHPGSCPVSAASRR